MFWMFYQHKLSQPKQCQQFPKYCCQMIKTHWHWWNCLWHIAWLTPCNETKYHLSYIRTIWQKGFIWLLSVFTTMIWFLKFHYPQLNQKLQKPKLRHIRGHSSNTWHSRAVVLNRGAAHTRVPCRSPRGAAKFVLVTMGAVNQKRLRNTALEWGGIDEVSRELWF